MGSMCVGKHEPLSSTELAYNSLKHGPPHSITMSHSEDNTSPEMARLDEPL